MGKQGISAIVFRLLHLLWISQKPGALCILSERRNQSSECALERIWKFQKDKKYDPTDPFHCFTFGRYSFDILLQFPKLFPKRSMASTQCDCVALRLKTVRKISLSPLSAGHCRTAELPMTVTFQVALLIIKDERTDKLLLLIIPVQHAPTVSHYQHILCSAPITGFSAIGIHGITNNELNMRYIMYSNRASTREYTNRIISQLFVT